MSAVPAPRSFFSEELPIATAENLRSLPVLAAGFPFDGMIPVALAGGGMVQVPLNEWESYQTAVRSATREAA
jgi:hypothetical protein